MGKEKQYGSAKSTTMKITLTRPPATQHNLAGSPITISGVIAGAGFASQKMCPPGDSLPLHGRLRNGRRGAFPNASGHFSFRIPSLKQNTSTGHPTVAPRPAYSTVLTELASVRVTLHAAEPTTAGPCGCTARSRRPRSAPHVLFQAREAGERAAQAVAVRKKAKKRPNSRSSRSGSRTRQADQPKPSRYSMVTTMTTGADTGRSS